MSRPADTVRPLLRVRQTREFAAEPISDEELEALTDAGRWSGSSQNRQPWRFIAISDPAALAALAEVGMPQTRALATAAAAIAIAMPSIEGSGISLAYDEGRAAERILVAASLLGLGAGISWVRGEVRAAVAEQLGLPDDRFVRTIVAVGQPTDAARQPKSRPGEARLPREETVFADHWPD